MENQEKNNQLQPNQNNQLQTVSKRPLSEIMRAGNKRELATTLKQYREKSGAVNFPMVMSVPLSERLPALYQRNYMEATALVGMGLASAFDRMVFKKKPSGELVNDIAEEILNTSDQDNIALEDLMLFLQGLVRGDYGEITELSIAKFMKLFNGYRDERHFALIEYRENQHLQYKGMGSAERSAKSDPLAEHFSGISARISEMKEAMSEKKQSETMKKADKYFGDK